MVKTPLSENLVAVGKVTHTGLSEEETACINDRLVAIQRHPLCEPYQALSYPKMEVNGTVVSSKVNRATTRNDYTIGYKVVNSDPISYAIVQKLLTIRMKDSLDVHLALVYPVTTLPNCKVLDDIVFPTNMSKYKDLLKSDFFFVESCSSTLIAIASNTIRIKIC